MGVCGAGEVGCPMRSDAMEILQTEHLVQTRTMAPAGRSRWPDNPPPTMGPCRSASCQSTKTGSVCVRPGSQLIKLEEGGQNEAPVFKVMSDTPGTFLRDTPSEDEPLIQCWFTNASAPQIRGLQWSCRGRLVELHCWKMIYHFFKS